MESAGMHWRRLGPTGFDSAPPALVGNVFGPTPIAQFDEIMGALRIVLDAGARVTLEAASARRRRGDPRVRRWESCRRCCGR